MRRSHFLLHYFFPYLIIFSGCAADFHLPGSQDSGSNAISSQSEIEANLTNARVSFLYSDYYSLTSPNPSTGCAGDAKNYYDAINLSSSTSTSPAVYATNLVDSTSTIRPLFIKNISVDITDANSSAADNAAQSCSYGTGVTAPSPSTCATFDYGATGGIPSLLGGTLLIFGGMSGINYSGINSYGITTTAYNVNHGQTVSCGPILPSLSGAGQTACSSSLYALGVNALSESAAGSSLAPNLSSATDPISIWKNLSSATGYSGPTGASGSAIAYNDALQRVILFGGSTPMTGLGSTGVASNTYDTWVFDVKTQAWQYSTGNAVVDSSIQVTADQGTSLSMVSQGDGGRALFGYEAMPGAAISQFGSSGSMTTATASVIDTTDQIAIVGGYCSGGLNACQDSFLMNPTYGPQYIDAESPTGALATAANDWRPMQWLQSYYERKISNTAVESFYNPTRTAAGAGFPAPSPTPSPTPTPSDVAVSFGMAAVRNIAGGAGQQGAGYLVAAGGFHGFKSPSGYRNIPSNGCADLLHCGNFELMHKWSLTGVAPTQVDERQASNFTSIANINPSSRFGEQGYQNTPARWTQISDTATSSTPWFGGGVMLRGLNITTKNEVVFFGGTDCQSYLTDPNAANCQWPSSKTNPGRYWNLTTNPFSQLIGSLPDASTMDGIVPINAGMAAARGADPSGNPLIIAWGGMNKLNFADNSGKIYFLYKNTTSSNPTWGSYSVPSGAGPVGLANASLVYSHVSGKFYLFGGYSPVAGTSSATWELSVDNVGGSASCGAATSAACTFTWKFLGNNTGLTCYPNCPAARRSHRMVEVNYNNLTTGEEPVCTDPSLPCSFGIFMQGGSSDGLNVLNDRWMFDPTANGGAGHWQLMGDMPPRTLSSVANVDYAIPSSGVSVHRAVLFGGETGMQNPYLANARSGTGYFVPPTLGDTWMYDYTQRNWNRVQLYGERFNSVPNLSKLTEFDSRQGSLVTDTNTFTLSPPPISGAVMVTRTQSKSRATTSSPQASDPATPLKIPEVFLFGGRTKDGALHTLDHVYKFCAGSTGEKPYTTGLNGSVIAPAANAVDDATCDAYDSVTNPNSPSPTQKFAGAWLKKNPATSTDASLTPMNTIGSFLGAGTYDSAHDLIISFGGLTGGVAGAGGNYSVTKSSEMTLDSTGQVWEYTPPYEVANTASTKFTGSWNAVPVCNEGAVSPGFPQGRYGHTLSFNAKDNSLVVVGGYDSNGALITQTLSDGTTIPEIWTGYRIDSAEPNGIPEKGIPAIATTPPCYYWKNVTVFGNYSSAGPSTGLAHMASVFIPSSGYSTGYYSTDDQACAGVGPISSPDTSINKLLAGGVYIDIDRSQLNPLENVLLNLTFLPLGPTNIGSDQNYLDASETAIFKIHLIHVGDSGDTIRFRAQPRYLAYAASDQYPHLVQDLAVYSAPTGQVRQEQVLVPLSADPLIDRIRIERFSGNAILIDAAIYRMGHP